VGRDLTAEDLDVADNFQPARERSTKEGFAERKARTRNDRVHARQERFVEGSERKLEAGKLRADRPQGRRRRSRIGSTHARAALREPANARKPRITQAENEDALSLPFIFHLAKWAAL
jgi:hypothetical protein